MWHELFDKLISQSPLLQGGLVLMIAGWLGYQLRAFPERVWDVVRQWTTRVIQIRDTHPQYEAWLATLTAHAVRRDGPRTLEIKVQYDEDGRRSPTPRLAAGTDDFWARYLGKWCHVRVQREDGSAKGNLSPRFLIVVEMMWSRRGDVELLAAEVERRATVVEHRQLVDLFNRYGSRSTIKVPKRDPATLCLPRGMFESVEQRLREFCSAREQYERAGIPWRFGVLLHGSPGTGKTSMAHALASRLGLRIAVMTLADMESDQELMDVFRSVEEQAMVLIEDIDCAFRQRDEGGEAAAGVSFSGFLNCIDGVLAPQNGRVLVMTTNHIERLDPALIRPGRIDLKVEVPHLSRQDASDYADRIFPHVATRHDVVNQVMSSERPTPAVLINNLTSQRWHRTSAAASLTPHRRMVETAPTADEDDE